MTPGFRDLPPHSSDIWTPTASVAAGRRRFPLSQRRMTCSRRLTEHGVEPEEAHRRLTGTYIGRGKLKIALTDAGRESVAATTERLVQAVRDRLDVELDTSGPVEAPSSPETANTAGSSPRIDEHDLQITWDGFHPQSTVAAEVRAVALALTDFPTADEPDGRKLVRSCFLAAGSPIGVRIDLSAAGTADVASALAAIDRAAAESDIPRVHVSGALLARAELEAAQQRSLWNSAAPMWKLSQRSRPLLAALAAGILICFALRSVRRGAILTAMTAVAALLGVSLLRASGPEVDVLLFAAPLLACLLLLSGGLSIANDRPGKDSSTSGVPPFRLATIIAMIAVAPLMISSTPVVRQLGLLATACTGLALLLGEFVLPLLLTRVGGDASAFEGTSKRWQAIAGFVARRPRLIGGICGLLLLASSVGMGRLKLETGENHRASPESRLATDARFVEDNLAGTSRLDVIVQFDAPVGGGPRFLERAEIVRAAEQAVLGNPAVTGAFSLADLLPEIEAPPADASRRTRVTFNRRSNKVERQMRDGSVTGVNALLCVPASEIASPARIEETKTDRASEQWRISAYTLLPEGVSVQRVTDDLDAAVQDVLRTHPSARHEIAGDAVYVLGARRTVVRSLTKTSILACVFLMGSLIWLLRSPAAMLIAMLINVLPIAAVLGLAAFTGLRIDEEVLTVSLVGVIVCAHGAIQLLAHFRTSLQRGEKHAWAARNALAQRGPAGVRFLIVTTAALLVISRSDLAPLARIGGLLAAMIVATQLASLALLPSLLSGRIGRWFEKSLRPRRLNSTDSDSEADIDDAAQPSPHVRFEPAARDAVRPAV